MNKIPKRKCTKEIESQRHYLLILSDANFQEEVLNSVQTVLVVFGTGRHGAFHILTPILEQLSIEYHRKVKIGLLDIDKNKFTTQKYGILRIPTLLFFEDGEIVDHIVGLVRKSTIVLKIEESPAKRYL